ncbi:hypothetical protein HUN58_14630 [Curtobacterium sp. Csp1]|uniref:hypothetical protein n=1 Tax=Curtobacterium sp. Csp1 TaxID=2495429 RepID=UPI001597FB96|nr:hypothetical protein [Curtobacterium sp. Csp1]QKS20989.1 hypothetical protein HUN58_14630 [Curtobacterium sp. Csp1]
MTSIPPIVGPGPRSPQFWLDAAQGAVRRFCGWHVAPVITETIRLDGTGQRTLLVPSGRILDVTAATSDGRDVLAQVDVSGKGMLELRDGGLWSSRLGGISITLRHGYEVTEAPDVAGVIATAAARGGGPGGQIVSQAVGPANVRYSGNDIQLLQTELATLEPYRL